MGEENHVSVSIDNIEMEARKGVEAKSHQLLNDLSNLITWRSSGDSVDHFRKIEDFLSKHTPDIYEISEGGRNFLHLIAKEPLRDPTILELFGLSNGNIRQYLTEDQLKEFMTMKHGKQLRAPIHRAVEYGFLECAKQMLTFCPSLITLKDGEGNTPLHIAAICSSPEATDCVEYLLAHAKRESLTDELIVNTRNDKEQTPIHTLCSLVPNNKNSGVTTKLELLLATQCSKNALGIKDISGKTPLHLLCSHSKNPNLTDLVSILISRDCHNNYLNEKTSDDDRRTALHLACISELPEIVGILAQHNEIDVTVCDARNRMAIHYAAEKSIRPRSYQCVKILSDWSLLKSKMRTERLEAQDSFKEYLLWNCDCIAGGQTNESQEHKTKNNGNTVLTLACQAKSVKTVNLILRNLLQTKKDINIWFIGKDLIPNIYSLKQVYKNTPEALEFLFDGSIRFDFEKSDERRIEFTTDMSIITALARPVLRGHQSVSEMKYLSYAKRWSEDTQEKLLLHPLTQCILFATWQRMSFFNIFWFLLSIIWLIAYSILIPYKYSDKEKTFPTSQVFAAWILATFTVLYTVNELLEMKVSGLKNYFSKLLTRVNITHWLQILLTSIVIYNPICGSNPPSTIEKYCAAAGVAISYYLFWSNIGLIYLPLGIQVEYLHQALKKILKAVLCCVPLIIGFQRAFQQILSEHFNQKSIWAFTKVLVMMTGEFEYTSMFEENGDDNSTNAVHDSGNGITSKYSHLTFFNLIAFIVFLIIVPVAFYNLVTGLVVDKVKSLQNRIEVHQANNHIRLINYVQRTISRFNVFCCSPSYQYDDDGEIKFDQKKCWYIERNAQPSWIDQIRTLSLFSCNFGAGGSANSPFCGNSLPRKVQKQIFKMYTKQIADEDAKDDYD